MRNRRSAAKSHELMALDVVERVPKRASLDRLTQDARSSFIASVWAVWSKVDELDVARGAISLFAHDLSWARLPDALSIASRFASTLIIFPELTMDVSQSEVAERIRSMAGDGDAFRFALISQTLALDDRAALEALMLELARIRSDDLLQRFLKQDDRPALDNIFFSRLIGEIDAVGDEAGELVGVLASIADNITGPATLARQRLGAALAHALVADKGRLEETDPLQFADNALRARRRLQRLQKEPAHSVRTSDDRGALAVRLRARDRLAPFLKQRGTATTAQPPTRSGARYRSGIISWFDYQLSLGSASLDLRFLSSSYAERTPDGALTAREHPLGGMFQYGPYISLAPGIYHLRVIGSADQGLDFVLKVTSHLGQRMISSEKFVMRKVSTEPSVICELDFNISDDIDAVEFPLTVTPPSGMLTVEGIILERYPN